MNGIIKKEVVKENLTTEKIEETKATVKENLTVEAACKNNLQVEKEKQYLKAFPVISRRTRNKKERNVNCSCGNGKKYKNCCLIKEKTKKWTI